MVEDGWVDFDDGSTVGCRGSEGGTILQDEVCSEAARITLARGAPGAPFTVTCGIYGWMVHTRFFGNHLNAALNYQEMKVALAAIVLRIRDIDSGDDGQQTSAVCAAIEEFVKTYP